MTQPTKLIKSEYKKAKISPRKVYLIANSIRGKSIGEATEILSGIQKKGARLLEKTLKSAVANAKDSKLDKTGLFIKDVKVGPGPTLKKGRIAAKGRYKPILKRTTNIKVELDSLNIKQKDSKPSVESKAISKNKIKVETKGSKKEKKE